jgi:hypothetical protein
VFARGFEPLQGSRPINFSISATQGVALSGTSERFQRFISSQLIDSITPCATPLESLTGNFIRSLIIQSTFSLNFGRSILGIR